MFAGQRSKVACCKCDPIEAGNKRKSMHAKNARVSTATCLKTPCVQNVRAKVGTCVVQQSSPDTRRLIDVDQQSAKFPRFPLLLPTEFNFHRFKSPAQMSAIAIKLASVLLTVELLGRQGLRCSISGLEITYRNNCADPHQMAILCLDARRGYVPGNVALV
jgi:hypothetical protein